MGYTLNPVVNSMQILQRCERTRMAVLETQTFNYKAISFYKKNGFEINRFDRYAKPIILERL